MIDLQKKLDLPIFLGEKGFLEFHEPLLPMAPKKRTLAEMKDYLADPEAKFSGDSVYDMYRGVHLPQDKQNFKNTGIRFDITVFHPGMLGKEFCKTAGHFHPFKQGTAVRYPETYEVVKGNALFLMQRMDNLFEKVINFYAIEVNESQDVIFLPGYAHFLINPTENILITSNWSADNFKSEYEPVARYHGAAYYVLKGADGNPEFVPNPNYSKVPKLKFLKPRQLPQFGLINNQPAYRTGQKSPDMLQFLITPELYLKQLTIESCYSLL